MTMPAPHQPGARDLMIRMYDLMNRVEYDRIGEVIAADAIIEWPQSGERLRGPRPMQRVMEEYPGGRIEPAINAVDFPEREEEEFLLTPMFTIVRTESMGDTATSTCGLATPTARTGTSSRSPRPRTASSCT